MEIEFETCKKTFVKWNVCLPVVEGNIVKSKSFLVNDYNWHLVLTLGARHEFYGLDEFYTMTLYHSERKNTPRFPLTVYLRDNSKDSYLSQREISSSCTEIWSSSRVEFKRNHPNVQIIGTVLQFVFDFHLAISDPEFSIKEDKSIQTCATYSEENACLETLSLDLRKLVEEGFDPDVQLKCRDFSMGAHRLILGARSEVFRNMMQSDMREAREGFVEIDMEPKILEIFIRYIYTGILPELTADTALLLYEIADKYRVEILKKRSGRFLAKNLSPENALRILATADAHSDSDLKKQLVSYILKEKVPSKEVEWLKFCNQYPKLAIEVLNSSYKLLNVSQ